MSFRLACEASEMITAFVSLAGAATANADDCQPATLPVSGLVVHGTADATISYDGGEFEGATLYPGAVENTERIASAAGCDLQATTDEGAVDLVPMVDGAETDRTAYNTGCMPGVDAALWTVNDGSHIPFFSEDFADLATDWLLRHSR